MRSPVWLARSLTDQPFCLAQASIALQRFGSTVPKQREKVAELNREAFQSRNWTVEHLRLGEMQTLEALRGFAFSGLGAFTDDVKTQPSYTVRKNPCSPLSLQILLEEADLSRAHASSLQSE